MGSFFEDLMESVQQMDEIRRGERQPSREFAVAQTDGASLNQWAAKALTEAAHR